MEGTLSGPFSLTIPFSAGTNPSYSFSNSSSVELTGGVCRLKTATQTDDENSSSEFGAATASLTGVAWDSSGYLRLNTSVNNAELSSSWAPQWSSLTGYWKLNSGFAATTGSDLSASGAGASITSTAPKVGAGSANFNGAAYASIPAGATYSYPDTTFTVSFWFKTTQAAGNGFMVSKDAVSPGGWGVYVAAAGNITVLTKNCSGGNIQRTSTTKFNDGFWHQAVAVIRTNTVTEASNDIQLYIDGVANQGAMSYPGTGAYCGASATKAFGIGARGLTNAVQDYFTGDIDDVAMWSSGLTTSEIRTLYFRQAAKYSGEFKSRVIDAFSTGQTWTSITASTPLPFHKELPSNSGSETSANYSAVGGSLTSNLLASWHMNETAGVTLADSSGNGNNATIQNAPTLGRNTPFGTGVRLTRSSSQYISTPSLNLGNSFTLSIWAKVNLSTSQWITLFANTGTGVQDGFKLAIHSWNTSDFKIQFETGNGAAGLAARTNTGVSDSSTWHHYVAVIDRAAGTALLYVDGKQQASVTGIRTDFAVSGAINIGVTTNAAGYLDGEVDEAAIWTRKLAASEVLELYRRGGNRLKYQVRSCANSDCSDQDSLSGQGWKGPDNSNLTYFSEIQNNGTINSSGNPTGAVQTSPLSLLFSTFSTAGTGLSVTARQYFQYRALFESDEANTLCTYSAASANCSPELKSFSVGPDHYDGSTPTITSYASIGARYGLLQTFTESGGSCAGGLRYALSGNGANFYYWNGSTWAASSSYATASDAATIQANVGSFATAAGPGTIQVKTYLKSDGTAPCEVDGLQLTGQTP